MQWNPYASDEQRAALEALAKQYAEETAFRGASEGSRQQYGVDTSGRLKPELAQHGIDGRTHLFFNDLVEQFIANSDKVPFSSKVDISDAPKSDSIATLGGPNSELNDGTGPAGGDNFVPARMPFYDVIGPEDPNAEYMRFARASTEGINRMPGVFDPFYAVPETNAKSTAFFTSGKAADLKKKVQA